LFINDNARQLTRCKWGYIRKIRFWIYVRYWCKIVINRICFVYRMEKNITIYLNSFKF
jgi:hypothetical protein